MRAIFILICLLNQFTLVECVGPVGQHLHPECGGKVYACYIPTKCRKRATSLVESDTIWLSDLDQIDDDCPALFKYHAYSDHSVRVSIQSFDSTIPSIAVVFSESGSPTPIEFSCTKKAGKFVGNYKSSVKNTEFSNEDVDGKLHCEFDVTQKSKKLFEGSYTIHFKLGSENTKPYDFSLTTRCDPDRFKFKKGSNPRKHYAQVKHSPGEYYCTDDIFVREYKEKVSSQYEPVRTLDCVNKQFNINGNLIDVNSKIDIRCVAEAKYFCDYKPKAMVSAPTVTMQPYMSPPSVKIKQLKCPDTHPHLIVDQMKPFMNVVFECLNYNGELYWTVNETTRLTIKGPGVYCTNEVKCQLRFKLSESSVENGKLTVEGLPACYNERGRLFVNGDKVNSSRCDTSTGELKYRVDGKPEQVIREETKFNCITPDVEDTEQNAKNNKVLASSAAGFFGGAAILGIAIVAGVVFYTNRQFKKRQKRLDETFMQDAIKEEIMWKEHCMDKQEEKEYEDKREAERAKNEDAPASAPCVDPTKLSDTIMAALIIGVKSVSRATDIAMDRNNNSAHSDNNDAVKLRGLAAEKILPSTSVTPGYDAYKMLLLGSYIRKVDDWENE